MKITTASLLTTLKEPPPHKLEITDVDIQHEGLYTCVVSNEAGHVESEQTEVSIGMLKAVL